MCGLVYVNRYSLQHYYYYFFYKSFIFYFIDYFACSMIYINQKNLDATRMSISKDSMAHRTVIKGTIMDTNNAQGQPRQPDRRHQVLFSLQTNTVISVSLSPKARLRGIKTKWRHGWKAPACLWWFSLGGQPVGAGAGRRAFSPVISCIFQLSLQGVEWGRGRMKPLFFIGDLSE